MKSKHKMGAPMNSSQSNIAFKGASIHPNADIPKVNSSMSSRRMTLGSLKNSWVLEKPGSISYKPSQKSHISKTKKTVKKLSNSVNSLNFNMAKFPKPVESK